MKEPREELVGDFTVRTFKCESGRDRVEIIGNHTGIRGECPVYGRSIGAWTYAILKCLKSLDAFKDPKDARPISTRPRNSFQ